MDSNDDLAPSSLGLLPPPPPSPPSSSLPSQPHSTGSSSPPSRPIPIEIYNHILHFAFGRHLPPIPLENRLDEPPSLAPLLPLTLVSKGLRELVLPFLYHHLVIRRGEDWIQLFDPTEGILVGEGEEEKSRRGWVTKLSFARDGFPVASWTPSKDLPSTRAFPHPKPNIAPLDFSGLGDLVEVCIGNWGREDVVKDEIEAAVEVEMEGGPYLKSLVKLGSQFTESTFRGWMYSDLEAARIPAQTSSVLDLLSKTEPVQIHVFLEPFYRRDASTPTPNPTRFVLHPPRPMDFEEHDNAVEELWRSLSVSVHTFPSSSFNVDLILEPLLEEKRRAVLAFMGEKGWTKDEDGWWSWVDPSTV